MGNEIKVKFGTPTILTCTVASLANGAGRTSVKVDNSSLGWQRILICLRLEKNTFAAGGVFRIYLLREDEQASDPYTTDGIALADAALATEPLNAHLVGTIIDDSGVSVGPFYGEFIIKDPGKSWAIVVWNASGDPLTATAADHTINYTGMNPEIN